MARSGGDFTRGPIFVAQNAFTAGCFGCLGVATGGFALFILVFVVFQPQFAALFKTVSFPASPIVISIQPGPTVAARVSSATLVEIFVASEKRPDAARLSKIKLPIEEPVFICVRGPKGKAIDISIRIVLPDGKVVPFGDFVTDAEGSVVCLGALSELPEVEGTVHIEAVAGTAVVGSATLEVVL